MKIGDLIWDKNLKEKFVLQKIICHFCDLSKEDLWLNINKEISEDNLKKIMIGYKDYVDNKKPLEYILGYVQFFDNKFLVNENVLIPRPETEYMINAVNEEINKGLKATKATKINKSPINNVLLDIGTGCGVLWTSVLLFNKDFFDKAIFTDISQKSLEVAKINYKNLIWEIKTDVEFVQSDLLEFLINNEGWIVTSDVWRVTCDELCKEKIVSSQKSSPPNKRRAGSQWQIHTDVVLVANLPYIPEKTFDENAPVTAIKWEPKMAFVGWDDGLDYYKKMFEQIIQLRVTCDQWRVTSDELCEEKKDSKNENWFVMFLEMMTWQLDILRNLYSDFFEFEEVKTFHFNIRIVKAWIK